MSISLRGKVVLLFVIPTTLACILTSLRFKTNLHEYREAKETMVRLDVLGRLSAVVHETQKERGLSVRYLGHSSRMEELQAQRAKTDQALAEFARSSLVTVDLSRLKEARKAVEEQAGKEPVVARYTEMIQAWMGLETKFSPSPSSVEVAAVGRNIAIFERSKESAGLLRALGADVLTSEGDVQVAKLRRILELRTELEGGLRSPALALSEKAAGQVQSILDSQDWKSVSQTVDQFMERNSGGRINLSAAAYFEQVTRLIDAIRGQIQTQVDDGSEFSAQAVNDAGIGLVVFGVLPLIIVVAIVVIGMAVTRRLLTELVKVSQGLLESNTFMEKESQSLSSLAEKLVQAASHASESLHETATAAEEINSMVKRTSDHAAVSMSDAEQAVQAANSGIEVVEIMDQASARVAEMNDKALREMGDGNARLEKIVQLFQQIEDKTKVINDIVFQTRLLSFNASVEAARAGEAGRGFAVVAEEVGNLAQMSGSSAEEIGSLLRSASEEVASIISTTRENTERLSSELREKTAELLKNVRECSNGFHEIAKSVQGVAGRVGEISIGTSEQAKGVDEINTSVSTVGRLSDTTSDIAASVSLAAAGFRSQMSYLKTVVRSLSTLLSGSVEGLDEDGGEGRESVAEFEWRQELCIGVPEMDREHEILVGKINDLVRILNSGDLRAKRNEALASYQKLASYVVEHFRDEEELMERIGYSGLASHRKIHERLLNQAVEFQRALELGSLRKADLISFLSDWLISHIRGTDMKYVPSYRSRSKEAA